MAESGLVMVLFTDLVGSTELSQRIGDAAADDLRRAHFESLRAVIATTGGEEVKTIGDAVMVVYRSAADAVAGAVGMQQAVDADNRRGGEPLAMRVGVSAGDATNEDGDWFGRPVVEASRLCAAADPGQILVASIVQVLAGSRAGHEMISVGELDLKGLPEPVAAAEVVWSPVPDDDDECGADADLSVPLPSTLERADAFSFVGRVAELETVTTAWKEVVAGGRRTVLVTGEPGIGKTRLTTKLAHIAHDQGGVVLWGACEEDLGVPYQPFAEAVAHLARSVPAERLGPLLGPLAAELVRLVPDLDRWVPGLGEPIAGEPESERYRLFEAVADLLVDVSAERPVVLVLDDLHWAGKPTLLLLLHLLRVTRPMRVLVVATYRDTDLDRRHPLAEALADLRRMPDVERVALTGLDHTGVTDFLAAAAGHDLDQPGLVLAEALQQETEGNPFFVREVLLHLVESGALVQRDGRWASDLTLDAVGLPEGVKEVIGRRLSRLPEATNEVLTLAAVIGRDFDLALLGAVHDGGQDGALEALEPAERAGLVRPTGDRAGRYTFDHALVRSTLYDELSTSAWLRLHRDVGRALESRAEPEDHLADLARHFAECAALGESGRAVDYGRQAATRATDDLAYEEAAVHLERALGALDLADRPDPAVRADLLLALGDAYFAANDARYRPTYFALADAARAQSDIERLATAAIRLSSRTPGHRRPEWDTAREHALLEEVLAALPPIDSGVRARALVAQAVNEAEPGGDAARRGTLAAEAVAMARRLGQPDVLRDVLRENWVGWWDSSRVSWLDDAVAEQDELLELTAGDDSVRCHALLVRTPGLMARGDASAGDADFAAATALVERLREPAMTWWWMRDRVALLLLRGRFAEGEAALEELAAYGQERGLEFIIPMVALYYRLRFDQGRLAEFESAVEARVEEQPELIVWRTALAAIYSETDQLERARPHVAFVAADDFARANLPAWLLTVSATGGVAAETGQLEVVANAYEKCRAFAPQLLWTGTSYERPLDLHRGRMAAALGLHGDADRHFAAAVDLCERVLAPSLLGETKAAWAHALIVRDGDLDRARALATDALTTAQELGMARLEVLATRALDSVG
ncbi:MAG TPA: AAA family ATPase [Acidimicrobiales bacterium]|nr:AAA family ATPase [Acidimicrobiales bacterium]